MDIYKFSDSVDKSKEYKYKILVYPNITYQKDLEKDSYVVVLCNIIKELNNIRNDLHWTILSPQLINSLNFENTEQIILPLPSYPNAMRTHFDFKTIMREIDWKDKDYDIVYTHLPEHALQLKNLLYNNTNINPLFIGYTHWTEFPEITNYEMTMMDVNILGLLEMEKCGINTQGQKELILKNAEKNFNKDVVKRLNNILVPQYLGWEIPKYENQITDKKIIVFNHRPHTYKNYPWFLEQMDKLWKQRQDFEVWVPLADSVTKPYMTNDKYDRFGYFSKLSSCYLGVCAKQKYAGWAISATDGMSVGVPYLFSDDGYYRELANGAGIYYEDGKDLLVKINNLLDDKDSKDEWSTKSLKRFDNGRWENAIKQFNSMLDETISNLPTIKEDTDSYKKIVDFVQKKKSVNKKDILEELGWGVRISFSSYRNKLRKNSNIKFTKDRYEVI
jgi:glycosyltransferase involved in cell wall biosynthesis